MAAPPQPAEAGARLVPVRRRAVEITRPFRRRLRLLQGEKLILVFRPENGSSKRSARCVARACSAAAGRREARSRTNGRCRRSSASRWSCVSCVDSPMTSAPARRGPRGGRGTRRPGASRRPIVCLAAVGRRGEQRHLHSVRSPNACVAIAPRVVTGGATCSAPAATRRCAVSSLSATWSASRTVPDTRRPASMASTVAAWLSSNSSSVARPASRGRRVRPSSSSRPAARDRACAVEGERLVEVRHGERDSQLYHLSHGWCNAVPGRNHPDRPLDREGPGRAHAGCMRDACVVPICRSADMWEGCVRRFDSE